MDIVQTVYQPGNVVKVGHRAFAVAARRKIHDRGGSAARARVNAPSADLDVVSGVYAVQDKLSTCAGNHVLDQRAGET